MSVRPVDGGGEVLLPASYVAENIELGYAMTAFSSQGRTVTTTHAVVGAAMTREALYVAATRGRESNKLYVDVEPELPGAEASHGGPERLSARQVLISVAHRRGAEASAHQAMAAEWGTAESLEQLAREHESLVAVAGAEHWENALAAAGLPADVVAAARRSPEWDGLVRALGNAEGSGVPVGAALSQLAVLVRTGAEPAVALQKVVQRWDTTGVQRQQPQEFVAGLVPRAKGIEDEDLARAVCEREEAIVRRARGLAEAAVRRGETWANPFGLPPMESVIAVAWWERMAAIAAYRDRWHITGAGILGDDSGVGSLRQAAHRMRARRAGQEAAVLSGMVAPVTTVAPSQSAIHMEIGPGVDI
jgi:hypothetical protein